LALLLTKKNTDETLYVVGVGCQHISGPFGWDNASLSIAASQTKKSNVTGEPLIRLFDENAGFELLCNSDVCMVRGLKTDIVDSFGTEFLSDHPAGGSAVSPDMGG